MLGAIIRFVVSAIVLLLVQWVVPDFRIAGFWPAILAAVIISVIGSLAEGLLGRRASPQARGFSGFIAAAVIIYLTQFLMPNYMQVGVIGALLAAFIIGLVDAFVPTELR